MTPFTAVTGIAAPLLRMNVDTDTIIPSREIKRVSKEGLAEGLFAGWRYRSPEGRAPDPDFVLNQPPFDRAVILVAGRNFGCGSSREHAVWALYEWGIRAIIAPGFGAIFRDNCVRNGLLPVVLEEATVEGIVKAMLTDRGGTPVTVDLENMQVRVLDATWSFELPDKDRRMLLGGLDAIAVTLQVLPEIEAFEARDRRRRPWASL